ncbi:MAG: PEP/pyruvate-binding domain-containing protein [Myxococcota bacterium]|nr:PEP/pyruvate-binding domain-containing protein [Myxococcota bacterium]
MPIMTSGIRRIVNDIQSQSPADTPAQLSGQKLFELLCEVGDRAGFSRDKVSQKLKDPNISNTDKLALIKRGINFIERRDLKMILDNNEVALSPEAQGVLQALLNRPVTDGHHVDNLLTSIPHFNTGLTRNVQPAPTADNVSDNNSLLSVQLNHLSASRDANTVGKEVAEELLARAKDLSSVQGSGVEHWGRGDPDLVERRAILSQLLDQNLIELDCMRKAWAKGDKEALEAIERTDTLNIPSGYNAMGDSLWKVLKDGVEEIAQRNEKEAIKAAGDLTKGDADFFEANPQTFSTAIINHLDDPKLKAQTLVDLLLQFRNPIDTHEKKEKMFAGGAGVQAVLELRQATADLKMDGQDDASLRNYALQRAVTQANPRSSSNEVLQARHLISNIRRMSWQLVYGPGAQQADTGITPYSAIHHNFSTATPRVIGSFVSDSLFSGGDPETFCLLTDAMNEAKSGSEAAAQKMLSEIAKKDPDAHKDFEKFIKSRSQNDKPLHKQIEGYLVSKCNGKLDSASIDDPNLSDDEKRHLRNGHVDSVTGQYDEKLTLCARLYRVVCNAMPNANILKRNLFSAHGAWPKVADVITHLETGSNTTTTLQAIVEARKSLKAEFAKHPEGHKRMDIWDIDRKLETLASSHLGEIVGQTGDLSTDAQMVQALHGMKLSLESVAISGLDNIRDIDDPIANKGPTIQDALKEIDALYAQGQVNTDDYRNAMATAYEAIVKTTENIRAYIDGRIPDVSKGKLIPNPAFLDDFIKEGPLHYARALAQKAVSVGLTQEISPTRIVNPEGVSVLNNLGRVVFDRVLLADTMADLKELGADKDDFCIVRTMDEKKMLAVGGIMSDFPGGYCHAAVYARGAGMAALSNPDIGQPWADFVGNIKDDKLYYDDSGGKIVLMPFKEAIKAGLAQPEDADRLRPGSNRNVDYLSWNEAEEKWQTLGNHEVIVHPDRPTHHIEIYTPTPEIKGLGRTCVSFEDMGKLGIDGRGLGGEKNTVLAMMSVEPTLQDIIPPGSIITTGRCFEIIENAGILGAWMGVYENDPIVGKIDDSNFLQSKFYTDSTYRENVRQELNTLVHQKVKAHLIGPDGKPTDAGKTLLAELRANPALKDCNNWIMRSSYSAEDRPYKSGAGQYDSFPNCRSETEILEGVVGVLASAWEPPPIENNVTEEYNLMHIAPSITAMKCLNAEYSGVMISRDTDTGHRRTVSYQVVKGFGGGVEEGITEEGRINSEGNSVKTLLPDEDGSILGEDIDNQLWEAAMEVERLFHDKVEPGKGYAVDMEWVFDKDDKQLYLVQARTVRV